jgi:hypothetical protein
MVLNKTDKEKQDNSSSDLAKKLILLAALIPQLRRWFKTIAKDFTVVYKHTGQILSLHPYKPELSSILISHYRKTAKKFSNNIRDQVDIDNYILPETTTKELKEEYERINNIIAITLTAFILNHSEKQAKYIIETTLHNLRAEVNTIITEHAIQGQELTDSQIAEKVKQRFIENSENRLETIATTETQITAEKAKFTEASTLNESNILIPGKEFKKQWSAILDDRVRDFHAAADGQIRAITATFDVNGEKLMFPGDDSLGASASNIINCRCSAITIIE